MSKVDYEALYAPRMLSRWNLPAAVRIEPDNGIFRSPLLRWPVPGDIGAGPQASLRLLCADVLVLERDLVVDRPTFVFCRRIERKGDASIVLDGSDEALSSTAGPELWLFAQQVARREDGADVELPIQAVRRDAAGMPTVVTHVFQPASGAVGGLAWRVSGEPTLLQPKEIEPEFLDAGEPLRLVLTSIFQIATLLCHEQPEVAIAQLVWVGRLAQAFPHASDLAAQAAALAGTLVAMKAAGSDIVLVPRLDPEVYASEARSMLDLLNSRQASWQSLQNQQHEDERWCAVAAAALQDHACHRELAEKIEAQAMASREQAMDAREAAVRQIGFQRMQLHISERAFECGIEEWKRQKTQDAAFELVMGVADLIWQVAKIAVAGPDFSKLPVVDTLKELPGVFKGWGDSVRSTGSKKDGLELGNVDLYDGGGHEPKPAHPLSPSAEAEKKTADPAAEAQLRKREEMQQKLASGVVAGAKDCKAIWDAAQEICRIDAQARAMEERSEAIYEKTDASLDKIFSHTELTGLDTVTGGEQEWERLAIDVEGLFERFQDGILLAIDGGQAYRLAFRQLMLCGRSLSRARLAVASATMHAAEMKLQRMAAERSIAIAADLERRMVRTAARTDMLKQLIYGSVLDAKRTVWLAMEAQERAFRYFTLHADPSTLPTMAASIDVFREAVAHMSSRLLIPAALERVPQTVEDFELRISDPALLMPLREAGCAEWTVEAAGRSFPGYGRIRIDRVRVFAEGLDAVGDISIDIETLGAYEDRLSDGKVRRFVGPPTQRRFSYRRDRSGNETVTVDGDIARRYSNDFFLPTPFTTWRVMAAYHDGSPVDCSKVTALRCSFHGEATPLTRAG